MTRQEATELANRLNAEHPDRATHHWRARPAGEGWEVMKIGIPAAQMEDLQAGQRAAEGPPSAEDPRSSHDRNVGGPWIGG